MPPQKSSSYAVAERLVINTGPLIAFERIDCLEVIGELPYKILCPQEVRTELDEGEAAGHPRVDPPWLEVKALAKPLSRVSLVGLDRGEAAVIQLANELEIPVVAIDEWKGRRAALAANLQVTGSLGILGKAKLLGLIPALKPLVERAIQMGIRYHHDLVKAVLEAVGE